MHDPHFVRQRDFASSATSELRSLRRSEARRVTGDGSPRMKVDGSGARVAIVASSWHEAVMDGLLAGSQRALADAGVTDVTTLRAPGSFELPIIAHAAARAGYDAVVALGVIIRGGTPHFEYVSAATTDGLTRVALDTGVPVGFGLLTCDSEEQALDRAGLPDSAEDKGREAVEAALGALATLKSLRPSPSGGGFVKKP